MNKEELQLTDAAQLTLEFLFICVLLLIDLAVL